MTIDELSDPDTASAGAHSVFDQVPIGITIFKGPEFLVEMANETYLRIVDKRKEYFVGKPLFDVLPEVRKVVEPLLRGVFATGIPYHGREFEVTLNRHGKGELAYFNFVYHPLEERGRITGIIVIASEVTAQVIQKQFLEESERKFRGLIDQSPIAMTIFRGTDFVIDMANRALLTRIWQKSAGEVVGKKLLDVFPELNGQPFPALLENVLRTGTSHSEKEAVAYIARDNGLERFYLDYEYAPLFNSAGVADAIMVTVYDVTEKVNARRLVEEAEERARLATEASLAGSFDVDLRTDRSNFSPRLLEIFGVGAGVSHAELTARIHPDDRRVRDQAMQVALQNGMLQYDVRIRRQDDEVRWVKAQGRAFRNEKGEPVRLLGTIIDISDHVRAEKALIDSERKFRLLSDALPTLVWTATPDGSHYTYNELVYTYSGMSSGELQVKGWQGIVHPDDLAENVRLWTAALASGEPYLVEHRLRRQDGMFRWMLSRAVPQRGNDGAILMWVGTSTDIHDQKMFAGELEKKVKERTEALEMANAELALRNQELLSFNFVASHDLQEPLRKIQTFASRIQLTEPQLTDENRHYFLRMQESARQMQRLIRDLLEYSRAGQPDRRMEQVDLGEMLEHIRRQQLEESEAPRASMEIGRMPVINGIPFQVNQLFSNLLANALKFTKNRAHPAITVQAALLAQGGGNRPAFLPSGIDFHQISVCDNGIGFDPGYKQHIFEVFRRLHNRTEYEGTGIGLAICKKIVDNHEGYITADSRPGEGAVFTVYLPAKRIG